MAIGGVHDPRLDEKYADLLTAGGGKGIKERLGGLTTGGVGKVGGSILGWWLAQKILDTVNQMQDIGVQRARLRSQAEMVTPQSLYSQAALPRAQQEESMARQALFQQLSGGVLGPSQLAKGEYMIGQ